MTTSNVFVSCSFLEGVHFQTLDKQAIAHVFIVRVRWMDFFVLLLSKLNAIMDDIHLMSVCLFSNYS